MNDSDQAVGCSDLRDRLKTSIEDALVHSVGMGQAEYIWETYKPEGVALVLADAILSALPGLQRALAVLEVIDAARIRGPLVALNSVYADGGWEYAPDLLSRLRTVGMSEQPAWEHEP